jgi:2-keto-4-pentenoate hydratase/2-oxohepta-3-ene-1,7-dioic acid hydratase in catechol pathway
MRIVCFQLKAGIGIGIGFGLGRGDEVAECEPSSARGVTQAAALPRDVGDGRADDGSVRDGQPRFTQRKTSRGFDSTGSAGPAPVTPEEPPRGAHGLAIRIRGDARPVQHGDAADLIFGAVRPVAIPPEAMTLTPAGVGHARKPPVFMRHGDVCGIATAGIGTLRNPIGGD